MLPVTEACLDLLGLSELAIAWTLIMSKRTFGGGTSGLAAAEN